MKDPRFELFSRELTDIVAMLDGGADADEMWGLASQSFQVAREDADIELFVAIDERDLDTLRTILRQWDSDERPLSEHDRGVLKRALKAFRKRLRLVRLDAESSVGGGPTSTGRNSSIVGVSAPDAYPQEVWDILVRQKRLIEGSDGNYELPPE